MRLAPRCAKLLLEAGATVNVAAQDSEVTPLHVAAARGLEEHVALYLEHGADVHLRTSQGETALNAACAGAEGPGSGKQHQGAARRLLAAGADARVAGRKRHTPLHNACANGCGALAELLLRHGACAGAPNAAGHTPMDCALQAVQDAPNWEPEVLFAALLDYGAQPVRPEVRREGLRKEAPVGRGACGWNCHQGRCGKGGGQEAESLTCSQRSVLTSGRTTEGYRGACPRRKALPRKLARAQRL